MNVADKTMHFAAEELSANIARTPEGFLLCSNVPIARTGEQIYGPDETDIDPGPDGYVHILRKPEEVFRPETLASFNAKPIINDEELHAIGQVTPENWREASVGIVIDVRRGEGTKSDLMIADMLITDAAAIRDVLEGKRQVSCGYRCVYVKTGDGRGEQTQIIGNHVALVERARCGIVCSIGDTMKSLMDRLKCAFDKKDKTAFDKTLEEIPADARAVLVHDAEEGSGSHVHVHVGGKKDEGAGDRKFSDEALEKKFGEYDAKFSDMAKTTGDNHKAVMDSIEELKKSMTHGPAEESSDKEIEGALKEEAPAGTGDAALAKDSAYLGDSFQETVALAEVIAPGIRPLPTFDSAVKPAKTYLDICHLRRRALQLGNNDPATSGLILEIRSGKELTSDALQKMPCTEMGVLFKAVGAMKKAENAKETRKPGAAADKTTEIPVGPGGRAPRTVAERQEYRRKYEAQRNETQRK